MNRANVRWGLVTLLVVAALGAAQPVQAQLKARMHGGITQPLASAGDYFELGPSVSVDLGKSLGERVDVLLDLGWDYLNTTDVYATPTTNLWRYGVGIEGALSGDASSRFLVHALAGVGATTTRSHEFWLASRRPYTFEGETINQTAMNVSGGVRLGIRAQNNLTWWLTGKLGWLPIKDRNADALKELARNQLDALSSALNASIQLGVTLF